MSKYTDAVERGLEGLCAESVGFCSLCPDCQDAHGFCCEHSAQHAVDNGEVNEEAEFSWSSCDVCGSSLGGDRYAAHAITGDSPGDGDIIHLEVCSDCVMYIANGDEPEEWQ